MTDRERGRGGERVDVLTNTSWAARNIYSIYSIWCAYADHGWIWHGIYASWVFIAPGELKQV